RGLGTAFRASWPSSGGNWPGLFVGEVDLYEAAEINIAGQEAFLLDVSGSKQRDTLSPGGASDQGALPALKRSVTNRLLWSLETHLRAQLDAATDGGLLGCSILAEGASETTEPCPGHLVSESITPRLGLLSPGTPTPALSALPEYARLARA